MSERMSVERLELGEANAFVAEHHRHHKPVVGALLTRAGAVLTHISEISDTLIKRDPASYNIEDLGRELRKIARALQAEITAGLADAPDDGWNAAIEAAAQVAIDRSDLLDIHGSRIAREIRKLLRPSPPAMAPTPSPASRAKGMRRDR